MAEKVDMKHKNCICNIENFSERTCTGCRACEQICPKNAITISPNTHGFLMPKVDEGKCIDCGICKSVCHLNENKGLSFIKANIISYAAKAKDWEVRKKSSSGGVFHILAEKILHEGGVVYGAAFDESFTVQHVRIDSTDGLSLLYGSKYVQSDLEDAFSLVAADLQKNVCVLFSGTPCQIAALQSFLFVKKIDCEKLLLVEVVCHGVPSPLVWQEYLASRVSTSVQNIKNIYFRHKKDGWHARIKVRIAAPCFGNTHLDSDLFEDSEFNELFLSNLTLRESCHECHYAKKDRVADITLCDFWGIENTFLKDFDDDKGVSAVIINSKKGAAVWNEITSKFDVRNVDFQLVAQNQQTMNAPFPRPQKKDDFWSDFYTKKFGDVSKKYVPSEYKTRIYKYIVVASDGSGSKGDEGMLRGVLGLLNYDDILLISPNKIYPCSDTLLNKKNCIDEICIDHEHIADEIKCKSKLVIVGADVIDGTCGVEYSLSRIKSMKKMLLLGGEVFCFSSFRSNVDERIVEGLNEIINDEKAHFFVRDDVSKKNFSEQINGKVDFFPDFAFFCERKMSFEVQTLKDLLSLKKNDGFSIVGVNFSEPSFTSFYREKTLENRIAYVTDTLLAIISEQPRTFFVLLSNDTREWEGHLSDSSYQLLAEKCLKKIGHDSYIVISPEISYPEMLELLVSIDCLVSARMHLSIAAMRCGTIPIVYTGNGTTGTFSMSEKVEGMFKSRLGRTDLLVTNKNSLGNAVRTVFTNQEILRKKLSIKNNENAVAEKHFADEFKLMMNVTSDKNSQDGEALTIARTTIRELRNRIFETIISNKNIEQDLRNLRQDMNNKNAHIEQLLQSERDLKNELNGKDAEIARKDEEINKRNAELESVPIELANKTCHVEQLLQSERDLKNELNDKNAEIAQKNAEINALHNSASWKVTKPLRFAKRCVKKVYHICVPHKICTAINIFRHKGVKGVKARIEEKKYGRKIPASVEYVPSIIKKVVYEKLSLPKYDKPLVSIVIPVFNQFDYTYKCILSILNTVKEIPYEIIIGDDLSTDETKHISKYVQNVRVNNNKSDHGFLMNCNRAAKLAKGKYILFLNNDTQVQENWLSSLVSLIESDEKIGMVGSKLVFPDGVLQEAGGIIWNDASGWNYGRGKDPELPEYNYVKEADYISGASIMIRSSLWNEIGGFDERYKPAYYEDSDLAFEVRKHGFKVMYQPKSVVVHFEGVSNGTDLTSGLKKYQVENREKFVAKWADELKGQYENAQNVFFARERNFGKKVILIIDHYVPTFDKDAGSKTTFQYIKMFLAKGYAVKFIGDNYACKEMEPYTSVLLQLGVEVLYGAWYAKNILSWIKDNENNIDFVYLNRPHIAAKYIDFIKKNTNIKIIYYGHDLHFFRAQREYELTGNEKLKTEIETNKKNEFDVMHKSDVVYYPSYLEERAIKDIYPNINVKAIHAYIFENKSDVKYLPENRNGILFVGGFSHTPNVDAVKWFVSEVFPLIRKENPKIEFYIVGSNAPDEIKNLAGNGIVFKGFVTEDELSALYGSCRIVVVPLRYGAGVKGKVIEALYNGCPIVTTNIGAEGISGIEDIVEIHDSPAGFAESVLKLYGDVEKLTLMSHKSVEFIKENFSMEAAWNVVKEDFE